MICKFWLAKSIILIWNTKAIGYTNDIELLFEFDW
jgi:hypothetical protein